MYCSKCGNELKNDEQFCSKCGTKAGLSEKPITINIPAPDLKSKAIEIKQNFITETANLGKNRALLFANIALLLLSMIFSLTQTFKVSAMLGVSMGMSMFEEMDGVRVGFIIAYIVSIVVLFLPLLLKKSWNTKFFLPAKITTIASTIWFFIFLFLGLHDVSSSMYSSMAEFNITATGWMFIVATLGAIVLSFKLTLDIKKAKRINTASSETDQ